MNLRKLLALLLAAVMLLGVLSACGNGTTTTPDTPPDATDTPADDTPAAPADDTPAAPADDATDAPADDTPAAPAEDNVNPATGLRTGGLTLPLCDELTEISVFRQFSNQYISDPNEIGCYSEVERYTNVHVKWHTYSATEQFPLYIAAQDFDDIISTNITTYTGGIDKAIEDECYVDATPYLSMAPNFAARLAADPEVDRQSRTDTGNLFFSCVQSGEQPAWLGPMVRIDWLADCGLDTPVTFDDWHEMLVAFRDQCGAQSPLLLSKNGYTVTGFGLTTGFNTAGTFYAENGTTVKYGFLDDSMRDYVALMAQWYSEGLIDKDFMSHSWYADGQSMYCNGETGAFDDLIYTFRGFWPMMNQDESDDIAAVPFPSQTEAEQGSLHFRRVNEIVGNAVSFITTAAVDRGVDELCARWLDYGYSEDGAFLLNYGVQGKTWELGKDGLPHFTDFYLNNPDYTSSEMSDLWTDKGRGEYYMWIKENDMYSAEVLSAYDIWGGSSTGDWVMPAITMTAEEAEDYSSAYGNIETYVNENVLKIIVGEASIDTWDTMVQGIQSMGIQDCIDIQQAALDRYNAR